MIERSNPEDMDEIAATQSVPGSAQGRLSRQQILSIGVLLLTATASFGFGVLTGRTASSDHGLIIGSAPMQEATTSIPVGGQVVGSKSMNTYYLPWCAKAAALANTDKIWFATENAAIAAGYVAGKRCAGI
jgi:hypothetical protein